MSSELFPWRRPTLLAALPTVVGRLLPLTVFLLAVVLGRDLKDVGFEAAAALVAVVLYAMEVLSDWLFTRWRVTDTVIEVRSGMISRKHLTVTRDRVRTLDTEAGVLKRVFRIVDLKVGTGVEREQLVLKGLRQADVDHLRTVLTDDRPDPVPGAENEVEPQDEVETQGGVDAAPPPQHLARFAPGWLRLAPLTSYGIVGVVLLVALISQVADLLEKLGLGGLGADLEGVDPSDALAGAVLAAGFLVVVTAAAFVTYALRWWNLRLERRGEHLHLEHGLLSLSTTTVEERRILGIRVVEPVLLRLAHGAKLTALASGTGVLQSVELLPPAPLPVVTGAAESVLRDPAPLRVALRRPVPAAVRRRYPRAQWHVLTFAALLAGVVLLFDWPWARVLWALAWVPLGVAVAWQRARNMGYALTPEHLVIAPPRVARVRIVLRRDGIISWNVFASPFQRRLGLVSLVATTAVGDQQYAVVDVPRDEAVRIMAAATPRIVRSFLAPAARD